MLMMSLLVAVGVLITIAAVYDATTLTIPNWLSIILVALFPIAVFGSDIGFYAAGIHLGVGFAALITGMALFAFGLIGGGDAKLFAAAALFMGLPDAGTYLVYVVLAGGALALVLMTARRAAFWGVPMDWFLKFTKGGSVIPYGIAIAFGALAVLPQTQIFSSAFHLPL